MAYLKWSVRKFSLLLSKIKVCIIQYWDLSSECCFQPGCVYHVQLKAEGNDHIERALPQHRAIEVIFSLFFVAALKYEMGLSRHSVCSVSSIVVKAFCLDKCFSAS